VNGREAGPDFGAAVNFSSFSLRRWLLGGSRMIEGWGETTKPPVKKAEKAR